MRTDKALDYFINGNEKLEKKDISFEDREKRLLEPGFAEEGMIGGIVWR